MLGRDAVSSEGSSGGESASKLTHVGAGRIQFFKGYWVKGLSPFLVAGEKLSASLACFAIAST